MALDVQSQSIEAQLDCSEPSDEEAAAAAAIGIVASEKPYTESES